MISFNLLPLPLLALIPLAIASDPTILDLNQNYTCPTHLYNVHIFSHDPLVIYIPSFITEAEASHLQAMSLGRFTSSQVADASGQHQLASTRTSRSTSLHSDQIVRCIEEKWQGCKVIPQPKPRQEVKEKSSYKPT